MEEHNLTDIFARRQEIELELTKLLEQTGSDFSLEDIQQIIYNEDGHDDMTKIIMMFDTGQGSLEIESILETIIDAWNFFPHKAIGGISPAEKALD
jgi:hypothetical protein